MQFEHHGHGLSGYIPMAGTRLVLSPSSIVALSITMEAAFCVETLEEALASHGKPGKLLGARSPPRWSNQSELSGKGLHCVALWSPTGVSGAVARPAATGLRLSMSRRPNSSLSWTAVFQ